MRYLRLSTLGVLALAALATTATAACTRPRAVADTEDVPTVAVAKTTRGSLAQTLTVTAEFRPFQEIDLHAKVAGYLKSITVDVGDRVRAGQLLATLEIPELQDALREDEAGVKRAEQEINRAKADVDRAESVHQVAHLGAARLADVMKARPQLIAQQDIDEAAGRDRVAEAQVATAKAALASAEQQLEISKANEAKSKTLLAYSQITAPFAGVITQRYADTGAMIQAGTSSQTQAMPVVKLSDNSRLRLVIPVPESGVSRIHVGAPVDLHVQTLQKHFSGTVARLADRLDTETRTMRVEVDVPNPKLELVPGMFADASIVLAEARDAIVAPIEGVDRTERTPRVLVVGHDQRIEPRDVAIGLETSDRVQITHGLNADELVVMGNRSQLKAGTLVSPKVMAAAREPGDR